MSFRRVMWKPTDDDARGSKTRRSTCNLSHAGLPAGPIAIGPLGWSRTYNMTIVCRQSGDDAALTG